MVLRLLLAPETVVPVTVAVVPATWIVAPVGGGAAIVKVTPVGLALQPEPGVAKVIDATLKPRFAVAMAWVPEPGGAIVTVGAVA
jgi:hypothetical protein